jgi:exonuclease SbcC
VEHEARCLALRDARSRLLSGRPAALVDAELRAAVASALEGAETAAASLARARAGCAGAEAAAGQARLTLEAAESEAARAGAAMAEVLASLGCDRAALAAWLAHTPAWVEARRAELASLEHRAVTAAASLHERRLRATAHEAQDRPALDAFDARTHLDEALRDERIAAELLAEAAARLRQDDDRRDSLARLGPRLADQERRARTWGVLSEVIGSADGKKLRVFAQSLTLEALVAAANGHLRDLAPRYRLMRVPGTDLELQVMDGDLGDEPRGVNGLSGGESFLVSLALALGLSSLSTRATCVETLFVDEGFGSLDRDSLDHAVVALEALRATGRTVGVISHVPELQERLGAQVRVEPVGAGRSRVRVLARAP